MDIINPVFRRINAYVWPFAAGLSTAFSIALLVRGDVAPAIVCAVVAVADTITHFVVNKQN